ncbi:hypothetical protein Sste5346_008871 [Sporothrix stenoceras]|uniref:Carboxylic ester hydrolase n=1 Tax=Sporothrix stenoceras TaxID=5173 RepID=A0ABR3YME7_9PEZI
MASDRKHTGRWAALLVAALAIAASLKYGQRARQNVIDNDLLVRTPLFTYKGAVNDETPLVRQFLGIPFAEPPTRSLRFRPPVTKRTPLTGEPTVVDATQYGAYCYQHDNGEPSFFRSQPGHGLPENVKQSEDCLTLDVWTRRSPNSTANTKAAVLIWIHGGALMTGDSSTPYQRGNRLVANHEDVVVVSVNYRVNIFGFPRAGALDGRHLNPGFLDVRLAVEWIHHNIGAFGGDPARMVLFGNSAGGTQVDKYAYAWAHDPLVTGYICMSGQGEFSADPADVSNFTYVAERVGCAGFVTDDKKDYDGEMECMQAVDADKIIAVLNNYDSRTPENGGRVLNFQPQTDNETSFGNYTDLQVRGLYAPKLPQVIGNVANEMVSLYHPWTGEQPDQEVLDLLSGLFVCPAAKAAKARQEFGSPVWRFRYFGDFPNMNPEPWLHAYHGSEVPMVFGTTDTYAPNTPEQDALSLYMQSAWVAFAKDPVNGLLELGWPHYIENQDTLVRLGYENALDINLVQGDTYDELCPYVMSHMGDVVKRAMPP